jgi:hypothetical protein
VVTQNFYDALKGSAQKAVCAYLNAADKASSWLGSKSGIYLGDPSQYWKPVLCDGDPADSSNAPPPPFEGGQCAGVLYSVTTEFKTFSSIQTCSQLDRTVVTQVVGPVQGLRLDGVVAVEPCGFSAGDVLYLQANDSEVAIFLGGQSFPIEGTASITDIVRVDGQPDECGDPSPAIPDFPASGDPLPTQPPTTYDDPSGNPVTIAPEFTVFAPIVVGPNIYAPVRIDLPDVTLDGTLTLAPEFNLTVNPPQFDGSPGDSPEPTATEDPITSPNTPDDQSAETLIGAFVRSQEIGYNRQTQIGQDDSPTLIVARLARIYFRVRISGRLGWIGPYDVQGTNQYFPVPSGVYAVRAQAEWESGWAGEVVPVYGLPNSTAL